jgi:hypothetical protein
MEEKMTEKISGEITISVRLNTKAVCRLGEIAMQKNITPADVMRWGLGMVFTLEDEENKKEAYRRENTKEGITESLTRLKNRYTVIDMKERMAVNIVELLQNNFGYSLEDIEKLPGMRQVVEDYKRYTKQDTDIEAVGNKDEDRK